MNVTEASKLRASHDADARALSSQSKAQLEAIARQRRIRIYGTSSKAELVSEILDARYPRARLNEAIHVLHHAPGERWSACEHCNSTESEYGSNTDRSGQ